jgi:hypothetical protein
MRTIRILLALLALAIPATLSAQVRVSITVAPPVLPIYEQPICPGDGYLWTPGYWAWDPTVSDYYWVPGTWVLAPEVGFFWTPGYWGWGDGGFFWNEGWWGPSVGFYGGINYGFGYFGVGFAGGRWDGGHFFYNRAVSNVNVTVIHNVYNTTVENNSTTRVSYNGGNGGVVARPTPEEQAAAGQRHIPPVQAQVEHAGTARSPRGPETSANILWLPLTAQRMQEPVQEPVQQGPIHATQSIPTSFPQSNTRLRSTPATPRPMRNTKSNRISSSPSSSRSAINSSKSRKPSIRRR